LDLMPSSLSETMLIVPNRWVIYEQVQKRVMWEKVTILIQAQWFFSMCIVALYKLHDLMPVFKFASQFLLIWDSSSGKSVVLSSACSELLSVHRSFQSQNVMESVSDCK
jgi:hypothetical protein